MLHSSAFATTDNGRALRCTLPVRRALSTSSRSSASPARAGKKHRAAPSHLPASDSENGFSAADAHVTLKNIQAFAGCRKTAGIGGAYLAAFPSTLSLSIALSRTRARTASRTIPTRTSIASPR